MALRYQIDRLEQAEALDKPAAALAAVFDRVVPEGRVRDFLHGLWLGHPLHPVLTDVTLGCWTAAAVLDVLDLPGGSHERAARTLIGTGVLSATPTAVAGLADWVALGEFEREKRVGVAHAVANSVGAVCYAGSWLARKRGRRGLGLALSALGGGAVGVGGMIGGHLAYRQAIGVDHTKLGDQPGDGWARVAAVRDLADGQLVRARANGVDVMVCRRQGRVYVLSNTCAHMAGPLSEGSVVDRHGTACVVCPWHGSTYALEDGRVVSGPSTAPQPAWDVRLVDGWVEARPHPLAAADGGVVAPAQGEVRSAAEAAADSSMRDQFAP